MYFILNRCYVFRIYTMGLNLFMAKTHTDNCVLVRGPIVDKQQ